MPRVGLVLSPGFQMMCFAAISAFEIANVAASGRRYDITLLSEEGGRKSTSARRSRPRVWGPQRFDTIIAGGLMVPQPSSEGLIAFLRRRQLGVVGA